jgi:hypothetical protein
MEPGSGVRHPSDPKQPKSPRAAGLRLDGALDVHVGLSGEQRAIIGLLQVEDCGLTSKQLQSRLPYPAEDVARALGDLVELRLVSQLNTLVPSYAYRSTAARTDGS